MAESAVADAPESDAIDATGETDFDYPVDVADAGPAAKRISVTIPESRITERQKELFGEIGSDAVLPGFRRGKAPKHLVQKKFGKAVRDQVQGDLIRESYQKALAKSELRPLGDPEFDDAENIKLPDSGDMTYAFTVEVRPDVTVPEMDGLTIKKPKITIKDEHVDQALVNLQNQQGTLGPVEGRGVAEGDYLFADVVMTVGEETVAQQNDARLVARSGRIGGVLIEDFAKKVDGMNVGDTRAFDVKIGDDHQVERLRGQQANVSLTLKDVRQLHPAEIDDAFLEELGFENKDELMAALREQMEERVESDVKNVMRRQVREFLVNNASVEVPEKMSARQTDRVVSRRAMTLLQRGVSEEKVRAAIDKLREGADDEAKKELKVFFILDKVAEENEVNVDEDEINGQVAMLAIERDQRPEALLQQMQKDGSLMNLAQSLREQKALDVLVEKAKIEEVEPTPQQEKEAVEGPDPDAEVEDVT